MPEELTNVIDEAAVRNRFDVKATRRAMARANGRRNLAVLEQAIDDWLAGSAGLKSRKERDFLVLVTDAGLPRPRTNCDVLGNEVDFHWPAQRLVVEVDGGHHSRPPTQLDDRRRDRAWRPRAGPSCVSGRRRWNIGASGYWQPSNALWHARNTFPVSRLVDRRDNRFVSAYSLVPQ